MKPFNQGYCWVVQARPRCMVLVLRNPNWFAVGRPAHSFVLGSCRLWINKFLQPILKFSLGSHSLPLGQAFYCDRQAGDRALGADCGQTSALNQSPSACWVTPATGLAVGCRAAGLWDVISPFTTPQSDGQQCTEKCQTCTKSFPHFRGKHCIRGKRSSHHFHVCWQPRPPLPSFSPCVEFYC